jgi:hypothetical protein
MVCQHLEELDEELSRRGIDLIYRDWQPWGQNCRNWTRYTCYLELSALRARLKLADCVVDHVFRGFKAMNGASSAKSTGTQSLGTMRDPLTARPPVTAARLMQSPGPE